MRKKKYKKILLVLIGFLLFYLLYVGVMIYLAKREYSEHDRLPTLLSKKAKLIETNMDEYKKPEYTEGFVCNPEETRRKIQNIEKFSFPKTIDVCKYFKVEDGNVFWLGQTSFGFVFMEKFSGEIDVIIHDTGEYGSYKNYPGIFSFAMKGNGKDVIFIYEGWNLPQKVLKIIFSKT